MATDYGLDLQGADDLPDPEVTCSGELAAAYACARRLLTPSGALQEIGETEQYDSIDVRDWLGQRFDLADPAVLLDLQTQAQQVLVEEPFVLAAAVVVTFGAGVLTLTAQVQGAQGPFTLVLAVDALTVKLLLPGQTS